MTPSIQTAHTEHSNNNTFILLFKDMYGEIKDRYGESL